MASIDIPGLVKKERVNGPPVYYWQAWSAAEAQGFRSRPLRRIDGTPMDEGEAIAAARAIVEELERVRAGAPRPRQIDGNARSFARLIRLYRAHTAYKERAAATRKMYDFELSIIERQLGDIDVRVFGLVDAKRYLKAFEKPSRKRAHGAVLRTLMSFAADDEGANWIALNPLLAAGRKKALGLPAANVRVVVPSYPCEAAMVNAAYVLGLDAMALAIVAAASMGQRETDVLLFDDKWWNAQGQFEVHQQKRKAANVVAYLPFLPPRVEAALARVRARRQAANKAAKVARLSTRWILNPNTGDKPYALRTFQQQYERIRAIAGGLPHAIGNALRAFGGLDPLPHPFAFTPCAEAVGIQFRDYRDAFLTRGIEAGCTEIQMCAVSGHKPKNLPYSWRHYLKLTPELARQCMVKMMAHEAQLGIDAMFKEG
jgi:hypothetical protein